MPLPLQNITQNRLLAALSPADFKRLRPHLRSKLFKSGEVLISPSTLVKEAFFVEQGMISSVAHAADGEQIQVGIVGCEGMVGLPILLNVDRSPNEARAQSSGWAWCLSAKALRDAVRNSLSLQTMLLRYVQLVMNEIAGTALANSRYKLDQRLARWLLLSHDRNENDVIVTTHNSLALTLGVTRTTLSSTTADFVRLGIIASGRGKITILDRDALLAIAGAAYGVPEAEYARLIQRPSIGPELQRKPELKKGLSLNAP